MQEMNFTTIRPTGDRVLIQRLVEETTAGGLILVVEHALDNGSFRAKVLAVGPGGYDEKGRAKEMPVKPGDIVLLPALGPQMKARMRPVPLSYVKDAEHVFSVPSDLILAIMEEDAPQGGDPQ